jgi:hypothetical protein
MSRPNYGTERGSRRPEPAPTRAGVDWVGICGVILWSLAVVAALFVGVLVGVYVYFGLAALFGGTAFTAAVAYLATPCLLGGLTLWAGVVWWAGHVADRNRRHHR